MGPNNLYTQYKEQSLATMAPGEIIVKLFDELMKQCKRASIAITAKDYGTANTSLTKSQTIVATLADSLDMRYPISAELKDLYIFMAKQILQCNLTKDAKIADELVPIIKNLRDSFEQADKLSRVNKYATASVGGQN